HTMSTTTLLELDGASGKCNIKNNQITVMDPENKPKHFVEFKLQDLSCEKISYTLWNDLALKLHNFIMKNATLKEPIIMPIVMAKHSTWNSFGKLLEKIHVTWTQFEKKRDKIAALHEVASKNCVQCMETASQFLATSSEHTSDMLIHDLAHLGYHNHDHAE
ncbi:hypothetical protein Tco_1442159, partial [Tanacetum coccineum]